MRGLLLNVLGWRVFASWRSIEAGRDEECEDKSEQSVLRMQMTMSRGAARRRKDHLNRRFATPLTSNMLARCCG